MKTSIDFLGMIQRSPMDGAFAFSGGFHGQGGTPKMDSL